MKTSFNNTGIKETTAANRSKVISVADVWNIQRRKRSRMQRKFIGDC